MFKQFISWSLVGVAVFFLVASLLVWTLNLRVLNAQQLSKTLKNSGAYSEMAKAIPNLVTKDQNAQDSAKIKPALAKSIDEAYVGTKVDGVITSFINYIKTGKGTVSISLSDLPPRMAANGVEVPKDILEQTKQPIDLSGKNADAFSKLQKGYGWLKIATIVGPIITVLLLLLEWFITDKWHRFGRIGRLFVSAAIWGFGFWFVIARLSDFAFKKISSDPSVADALGVIKALISGVKELLSSTFMTFGIVCLVLGVVFYILHFKFELKPNTNAKAV